MRKLFDLLGAPADTLIAMEATGHYWKNLFATLVTQGFAVAVAQPAADAALCRRRTLHARRPTRSTPSGIARFAAQKRPAPTRLPDPATEELRELVRFRDRLVQDFGDRVRQLHRLVDLGFPEFTRTSSDLGSHLATTLLPDYPTAAASRDRAAARGRAAL